MNTRVAWIAGSALATVLAFGITWAVMTQTGAITDSQPADPVPAVDPRVAFTPPELTGPPRGIGQWPWSELRGGECLASVPGETVTVDVVSCGEPHQAKYLRPVLLSLDPGADYPGRDTVESLAEENCRSLTASQLGIGEEVADLVVAGLYSPDEDSWQAGHRVVSCVVYRLGGEDISEQPPASQ